MSVAIAITVTLPNTTAANAYSSAMFYIVTYVMTTLGTFGIIMLLDIKHIHRSSSLLSTNTRRGSWSGSSCACRSANGSA